MRPCDPNGKGICDLIALSTLAFGVLELAIRSAGWMCETRQERMGQLENR